MDRVPFCCLLFLGLLSPLLSLPVTDTGERSLQLPVREKDALQVLEELERTALLQTLRQALRTEAEAGESPGEADPSAETPTPRGSLRKAIAGQDSTTVLSRLLARTRKQHKQHGNAPECFWKYCI
ncbi:urotensin-2 [Apodemus sylvaticus]|uniref:urotensin-2 n=1 Tax=Apodemus sylvaticus TaxID=10129 RepID=UPI002242D10C|nr:urotensin-2 [Apodemus sylvaticus]